MVTILVAGDIMLDNYIFGNVGRISPEAPIPVFLEQKERQRYAPGGAANVAVNLRAAGVDVDLMSQIGEDAAGKQLLSLLESSRIGTKRISKSKTRPTTTKTRYIGQNNQQVFRVDVEDASPMSIGDVKEAIEALQQDISTYKLIVLSDYDKGMMSPEICSLLISLGRERDVPVLVDVKGNNPMKYRGATLLKPNRSELSQLTGMPVATVEQVREAAARLCLTCECRYVLATLGADGMLICNESGSASHIKTAAKDVYDVTGAGDTSLAYLAASLVGGSSMEEAIELANLAAGVQVSKVGTSVVLPEEVEKAKRSGDMPLMEKQLNFYRSGGFISLEESRKRGDRIVFTNGCFDILHAGHIRYLNEAKKLGDCLVVGVNSDASVRRLKGQERPINNISDRMVLLAGLECVDYVVAFEEDTPYELIKAIRPDVLVKGGDYSVEDIVGADVVASYGGMTTTIPYIMGKSTTGIIEKIKGDE